MWWGSKSKALALLAWILWSQSYGLLPLNDRLMVAPDEVVWRYREAFDSKQGCLDRRKALIAEQEAALAAVTPESPAAEAFVYRDYRCYPESINPWQLTREQPDE